MTVEQSQSVRFFGAPLAEIDPEIYAAIGQELSRQQNQIELIASENIVSRAVLEAHGSVLTNKYAEGYPGRRYYGGCEFVDIVEDLAIERARQLFGCSFANVQPHSGSQANQAVFMALMQPGETFMGLSLTSGGHLTHGSSVNMSGKWFKCVSYGVRRQDMRIDMDEVAALAREHKPKIIVAGGSAYPRFIDFAAFRKVADEVGAYLMVDMAHFAGLVAGGAHPSPVPHAHVVTTTTHKTLRGPRGGLILARANDAITKKLNSLVFPGTQGGPLMHVIAAKAVALLEALQPEFKVYQGQVIANARAMSAALAARGFNIVSGGTDNHLFLVNLVGRDITGKQADAALGHAHITVNKNAVPNDPRPPAVTSGLRLGTAAATTRGFGETEVRLVAQWIAEVLDAAGADSVVASVREQVTALCRRFPVYGS